MKTRKFKIKSTTLIVYKTTNSTSNLFADTEPTTNIPPTTTHTSSMFNK